MAEWREAIRDRDIWDWTLVIVSIISSIIPILTLILPVLNFPDVPFSTAIIIISILVLLSSILIFRWRYEKSDEIIEDIVYEHLAYTGNRYVERKNRSAFDTLLRSSAFRHDALANTCFIRILIEHNGDANVYTEFKLKSLIDEYNSRMFYFGSDTPANFEDLSLKIMENSVHDISGSIEKIIDDEKAKCIKIRFRDVINRSEEKNLSIYYHWPKMFKPEKDYYESQILDITEKIRFIIVLPPEYEFTLIRCKQLDPEGKEISSSCVKREIDYHTISMESDSLIAPMSALKISWESKKRDIQN